MCVTPLPDRGIARFLTGRSRWVRILGIKYFGEIHSADLEILYRRGTEQYRPGVGPGGWGMDEIEGAMESPGETVGDMSTLFFRIPGSGAGIWVSARELRPGGGFTGATANS